MLRRALDLGVVRVATSLRFVDEELIADEVVEELFAPLGALEPSLKIGDWDARRSANSPTVMVRSPILARTSLACASVSPCFGHSSAAGSSELFEQPAAASQNKMMTPRFQAIVSRVAYTA